jgi:pyruvate formate lyase activating enzyme
VWAGDDSESTRCHACGQLLIERQGYAIRANRLIEGNHCPGCQMELPGVWK